MIQRAERHKSSLFLLTLVLFAAFTLRLWNLGTQSLWHDEAWSVFSAYHPLAWGAQGTDPNSPPIFYLTLSVWQHLAGDGVWAMRYWSLLIGLVTVAVTARMVRQWFEDRAALLASFLVAISPILWVFSQEIRAYIAMPLLALILLALVDNLLKSPQSSRPWRWLFVVELITLYTHNLSVPLIAWLNVTVMAVFAWRRDVRNLIRWLVVQAIAGLLYLPWLLTQRPTGTPLNTPPSLDPATFWNIWQSYFTGIRTMVSADSQLMVLTAAFGLVALVALLAAIVFNRSRRTLLILSQAVLIPIFELAIILAAHIDFHPRYFIVGTAAMLIMIAFGFEALSRWRAVFRVLMLGTAILAAAITFRMTWLTFSSSVYQHDDFRTIAERYATLGANDAIIIPYGWEPTLDYYSRKMNFKARFINMPLHASGNTILDTLRSELLNVNRAEFLTWYQMPADVRGAYPCILSATGQAREDSLTVQGVKTEGYDSFLVRDFARFYIQPDALDFGTFRLDNIRVGHTLKAIWGVNRLCVITRPKLLARTDENWHLVTRLYRFDFDFGEHREFSKTDVQLLNDQQLPTSLWSVESSDSQFSLLKVPEGLPSGETDSYPLTISLYSSQSPFGLGATACEFQSDGACATYAVSKRAPVGQAFHQPDPTIFQLQPAETDIQMKDGVYLHRSYLPSADQFAQGKCDPISVEVWRLKDISQRLDVAIGVQMLRKPIAWRPLLVPNQQKALVSLDVCVPVDATGDISVWVGAAVIPNGEAPDVNNPIKLINAPIQIVNRVFTEPAINLTTQTETSFGAGDLLIGVDSPTALTRGQPFTVTLLWKALSRWTSDYVVFVHLLDSNGQVIAQSDSQPVSGERPTTSWLAGEYITDLHTLTWHREDYMGAATLEVGLYNPETGERIKLTDGTDRVVLPVTIIVK